MDKPAMPALSVSLWIIANKAAAIVIIFPIFKKYIKCQLLKIQRSVLNIKYDPKQTYEKKKYQRKRLPKTFEK